MLGKLLTIVLSSSAALYVSSRFVPGFSVWGDTLNLLTAGAVLGILNSIVKPILKVVSFPFMILTLGLFVLVINAILVWAIGYLFDFVNISNTMALVWTTLIVSAVNLVILHKV